MDATPSDLLVQKRHTLMQVRREMQAKTAALGFTVVFLTRVFRQEFWLLGACVLAFFVLFARWLGQYRRVKTELGSTTSTISSRRTGR